MLRTSIMLIAFLAPFLSASPAETCWWWHRRCCCNGASGSNYGSNYGMGTDASYGTWMDFLRKNLPTANNDGIEQKLDAINATLGTMNTKLDTIAEALAKKYPPLPAKDAPPSTTPKTPIPDPKLGAKLIDQNQLAEYIAASLRTQLDSQMTTLRNSLRTELQTMVREAVEANRSQAAAANR